MPFTRRICRMGTEPRITRSLESPTFKIGSWSRRTVTSSTGNIRNDDLMTLFAGNSDALTGAFDDVDFVEFDRDILIIHG